MNLAIKQLLTSFLVTTTLASCSSSSSQNPDLPKSSLANPLPLESTTSMQPSEYYIAKDGNIIPPDPGAEGDKTLYGIDIDKDGVRDDIERKIYINHQEDNVRTVMMVDSKAERLKLEVVDMNLTRKQKQDLIWKLTDAAGNCYDEQGITLHTTWKKYDRFLIKYSLNTYERLKKNDDKEWLLNGSIFTSPPDGTNTCDTIRNYK